MVFIAVNSGSSRPALAGYIKSNRIPWPTIVDSSRQFEKACGVGEISLSNIHQVRYVTPDGQLRPGDFSDLEGVVQLALQGARWNISPDSIPPDLRVAWRSMEFGDYRRAGKDIVRGLKSSDEATRATAERLHEAALKEAKRQVNPAMALAREGKFWHAYQGISRVCTAFADYDLPSRLLRAKELLAQKPIVKSELRADRKLQSALELASSRERRTAARGHRQLKSVVDDYPDTAAANIAREKLGLKSQSFR